MSISVNSSNSAMPITTNGYESPITTNGNNDASTSGIIFTNGNTSASTSGIIFTNGDSFDRGTFAVSGSYYMEPLTRLPK